MTNANRPLPYADDVETIPADEADHIQRVTETLELIQRGARRRAASFARTYMSKLRATPKGNSGCCPTCPKNCAGAV